MFACLKSSGLGRGNDRGENSGQKGKISKEKSKYSGQWDDSTARICVPAPVLIKKPGFVLLEEGQRWSIWAQYTFNGWEGALCVSAHSIQICQLLYLPVRACRALRQISVWSERLWFCVHEQCQGFTLHFQYLNKIISFLVFLGPFEIQSNRNAFVFLSEDVKEHFLRKAVRIVKEEAL